MCTVRLPLAGLAFALGLLGPGRAGAEEVPALAAALERLPDGDLIRFSPHRLGQPVALELAARVRAPAGQVVRLLADPAAYRRAVPSFVRAETLRTRPASAGQAAALLVAWELEIPLWNLEGELWLEPRPAGAVLELASGDLAPGRFELLVVPRGPGSVLLLRGGADLRNANWITRRLAAQHRHAEPAMAAAAAYVLLRALVLEAERGGAAVALARRPRAAPAAPAPTSLDGRVLAGPLAALAPLASEAALALVRSRPDGRLGAVHVALPAPLALDRLPAALAQPGRWRALPGWRAIEAGPAPGADPGTFVWDVDSALPFVDFDAVWWVTPKPRFRAAAGPGSDWNGPVMGWDLLPAGPGGPPVAAAVFSIHPRIDSTGFLPRRLIAAEPLLEHGLALGLAYVDALALLGAIERAPPP